MSYCINFLIESIHRTRCKSLYEIRLSEASEQKLGFSIPPSREKAITTVIFSLPFYIRKPDILSADLSFPFRLGGPDPLDYISMYANSGYPELGVPPHWHYIR